MMIAMTMMIMNMVSHGSENDETFEHIYDDDDEYCDDDDDDDVYDDNHACRR